jgi:hypothetical protein
MSYCGFQSNELPELQIDPYTPLILSEEGTGSTILRTHICELTGREPLPAWLIEWLLYVRRFLLWFLSSSSHSLIMKCDSTYRYRFLFCVLFFF